MTRTFKIVNKKHQGVDLINGEWVVAKSILDSKNVCKNCGDTGMIKLPKDDSYVCLDCYMKRTEVPIQ